MRGLAGWVGLHCSGRSARGILQQLGSSPWEVWGLNPKLASPAYSIRARKEPREHPAVKSSRISVLKGEMDGDTESLLKGQHTKFHLQPLALDSGRGRAKWTRDTWGESGVGGCGERTEGTTSRIPVLSHSPYCRSHLSQAEHSSPSGISLRGSNSPTHRNYSALPCYSLRLYHWLVWQLRWKIQRSSHMGRQRNRSQMKEQDNSPEEQVDEMEASNLSGREFRVIIIRILNSMKKIT